MPNHKASTATRVPNGIAAELPSPHRIRFMMKKMQKMNLREAWNKERPKKWKKNFYPYPEIRNDVIITFVFHRSPPRAAKIRNLFSWNLILILLCPQARMSMNRSPYCVLTTYMTSCIYTNTYFCKVQPTCNQRQRQDTQIRPQKWCQGHHGWPATESQGKRRIV